jgi:hypothetical protein
MQAQLLNDWKYRYTGQQSELHQGSRLDKQISTKTFLLTVGLTVIVIIMIALFAMR